LSSHLAQLHRGWIEAKSDGPGRGSQFTLRLPLAAEQSGPAALEPEPASTMLSPVRVLVVDDNRDAAESLALVLRTMGAQVDVAHDGPVALEAFSAFDPAIVLLDIGMPSMDGYDVARAIRQRDPAKRTTLVALTGGGQREDLSRALDAGFDHHLVKPGQIERLQQIVAQASAAG
jgi:CheY-like chemotaxis protein